MNKPLTSAVVAAALVAATMPVSADNALTYYTATNPRIIQVTRDADDDVAPARPPRVTKPVARPVASKEPLRRRPFNAAPPSPIATPEPEPAGPRRAVLSAPPPATSSLSDGPTPLRPTPRFGQPVTPPEPVVSSEPEAAPEPVVTARAPAGPSTPDDDEDHLPPPGDPRLAPPEPKN